MEDLRRANTNTPTTMNDFSFVHHAITALAPIFELDEINEISGINLSEQDYKRFIDFYRLKTPKQTADILRKIADNSFQGLIEAKRNYCLNKYRHGVFYPNA